MDEITVISHVVKNELDDPPVPHVLLQVRADNDSNTRLMTVTHYNQVG